MFGIGLTELLIIVIVALVFIGPEKMPDFAKKLGRIFGELRRTGDDLKKTVKQEMMQDLPDDETLRDSETKPPVFQEAASDEIPEETQKTAQDIEEVPQEVTSPVEELKADDKPGFAPGKKPIKKKAVKMDGDSLLDHAMDLSADNTKEIDSGEPS